MPLGSATSTQLKVTRCGPNQPILCPLGETVAGAAGGSPSRGKLKVAVLTDSPERFAASSSVYVNQQSVTIETCNWHKGFAIIKLKTIDSIEDAQKLGGQPVEIHHSQLEPLPEGQYYHFQLIGLEVWTTREELLGNITDILTAQSNDIYVAHGSCGEILIPAIDDVVKSIDINTGRMVIETIDGLLTPNKKAAK